MYTSKQLDGMIFETSTRRKIKVQTVDGFTVKLTNINHGHHRNWDVKEFNSYLNSWTILEFPNRHIGQHEQVQVSKPESSGGSCDYYKVPVKNPTTKGIKPYIAECNDVIESLGMTPAEANIFKEVWRTAAARTLGKEKVGHTALRGAEKIVFFADRNLIQVKNNDIT